MVELRLDRLADAVRGAEPGLARQLDAFRQAIGPRIAELAAALELAGWPTEAAALRHLAGGPVAGGEGHRPAAEMQATLSRLGNLLERARAQLARPQPLPGKSE